MDSDLKRQRFGGMDPVFLAKSKLRRRHFQECIDLCTELLRENPYDKVRSRISTLASLLTYIWVVATAQDRRVARVGGVNVPRATASSSGRGLHPLHPKSCLESATMRATILYPSTLDENHQFPPKHTHTTFHHSPSLQHPPRPPRLCGLSKPAR